MRRDNDLLREALKRRYLNQFPPVFRPVVALYRFLFVEVHQP
jgi:hypothetical protein